MGNPCFFFYFQPDTYWKPDRFWDTDQVQPTVPLTEGHIQITCDANIIVENEPDPHSQIQQISQELLLLEDGVLDPYVENALHKVLNERKLVEDLEISANDEHDLGLVGYWLDQFQIEMEITELIKKLNTSVNVDNIVKENQKDLLKELLDG